MTIENRHIHAGGTGGASLKNIEIRRSEHSSVLFDFRNASFCADSFYKLGLYNVNNPWQNDCSFA